MGGGEGPKADRDVDPDGFCCGWNTRRANFHSFLSGTASLMSPDRRDCFCYCRVFRSSWCVIEGQC